MSMTTNLQGRLRNTALPKHHSLLPLFEAVVNSMQAVAARRLPPATGEILLEVRRKPQALLPLEEDGRNQSALAIAGFVIRDNGIGFNDQNMQSFETLDSDYKASEGCRGVGRLLWLKAFESVHVSSIFETAGGILKRRAFNFSASLGIFDLESTTAHPDASPGSCIHLDGFRNPYQERAPKTAQEIACQLFEHCLWYFVHHADAPRIYIQDGSQRIDLQEVRDEYLRSCGTKESLEIRGQTFELTHLHLRASVARRHYLAWCAASRVVLEENLAGRLPGLHGKLRDDHGDFNYACHVTSPFLDRQVHPERTGFELGTLDRDLFHDPDLTLQEIRQAVLLRSQQYLDAFLQESRRAGRARVEQFVATQAPRYRPILAHIAENKLSVDPAISDKELDLLLYRQLAEIESQVLAEGHDLMNLQPQEPMSHYRSRLASYLDRVGDLKKSDLANYVAHRKVILDILEKAVERGEDGKYPREALIHELIMPLRRTSNEVRLDSCNLWLIDERLVFHDYLASDKPLSSMPIANCPEKLEPDLCVLNVFDVPLLVSDERSTPLASIVIVELKRPMRNDAATGPDRDPVEQALRYLDRIRKGGTTTASGRPIPRAEEIPGFCYIVCDLTPSVQHRCKMMGLKATSDQQAYFGHNDNYRAYIEVLSYDRLLQAARQRNRVFFDKLGLPTP